MHKTWLLDSGHGGVLDGIYQTPNKMFTFENGKTAYEGVINRQIKSLLIHKLGVAKRSYIDITNTEEDVPLHTRVSTANNIYKENQNVVYFSIHSNASQDHTASGFEVWTSKGQTLSDKIAEVLCKEMRDEFANIRFRSDKSDGDLDKESDFYVLHKTHCPAVLIENLFFDNYNDYLRLIDPIFIYRLTEVYMRWIGEIERSDL